MEVIAIADYCVRWVIGRALTDVAYRMLLVAYPDEALTGYDLTVEEISDLKNWTQRELEAMLSTLDNLIARANLDGAQDRSWGGRHRKCVSVYAL